MKRWITSVGLVAMVGCAQAPTTTVEEALTDCTPGGNYVGADLPPMYQWNGYTPAAGPGQLFLDYADPTTPGQHLAFLVDPGKGYVVWAAKVPDGKLQSYRYSIPGAPPRLGDCCHPPPPPPGGTKWIAQFVLEAGLRFLQVDAQAQAAVKWP